MAAEPLLARLATVRIGGSCSAVLRPSGSEAILTAISSGPYRILGGGSNVVLPDDAPLLTAVLPAGTGLYRVERPGNASPCPPVPHRFAGIPLPADPAGADVYMEADAGLAWGRAVMRSLELGCVGLHRFARIPCTVGGALFNNIHGDAAFFSDYVAGAWSLDTATAEVRFRSGPELGCGYDASVYRTNREVVLKVLLRLRDAAPEATAMARKYYVARTAEKSALQPQGATCGSVFMNLDAGQAAGRPSPAAAWYLDRIGAKGLEEGPLHVAPSHANFIVNRGGGTQAGFRKLVERLRAGVRAEFGVELHPEAELVGPRGETVPW